METGMWSVALVTVMALLAPAAWSHQATAPGERIGQVSFPVLCNPSVQHSCERAVALLHFFWYLESAKALLGASR